MLTDQTRPRRQALLVEDTTPLRTLLASTLEASGFDVVSCATASEAIKAFGRSDPDVLIADIDLGDRPNGVELATILRAQAPYLGVVFITNFPSTKAFERTIAPPPRYAFLQKDLLDSTSRLIEVIESALNDGSTPHVVMDRESEDPLSRLTPTQLELVRLMSAGLTNAQIADHRGSSLRAVERLITRAFEVLELNDDPDHNPRVMAVNLYTRCYGYPSTQDVE